MEPVTTLDARFSSPGATAARWDDARSRLEAAGLYWLTTVRADGRPHVTPLAGVWEGDAFYFCTGETEQKFRNLEHAVDVVVTTGSNSFHEGLDLVVEGRAEPVTDEERLRPLAAAWSAKYGDVFGFDVRDGAFHSEGGGRAPVFRVAPVKVLGFGKGEPFSQTRWRFDRP
jgi:nitroimidazol reductase NimA-like FMN-containing flavoprotein (pyridoxamine 5'-phosphate oxidase superfamily)